MVHRLHHGGKPRGNPPTLVNNFFPAFNSCILFSHNLLSGNLLPSLVNSGEGSRGHGRDGLTTTMSSQKVSNHSTKRAGQSRKEPITQTVKICHYTMALLQELPAARQQDSCSIFSASRFIDTMAFLYVGLRCGGTHPSGKGQHFHPNSDGILHQMGRSRGVCEHQGHNPMLIRATEYHRKVRGA